MLNNYTETKAELLTTLSNLRATLSQNGSSGNLKNLEYALQKLQDNKFNLVVMGEFKRGKTSFINALLGEAVLPMAVVPLISIITGLVYADSPSAEVIFKDNLLFN